MWMGLLFWEVAQRVNMNTAWKIRTRLWLTDMAYDRRAGVTEVRLANQQCSYLQLISYNSKKNLIAMASELIQQTAFGATSTPVRFLS